MSLEAFFPDTSHVIEDMTIHAGELAIVIDGKNNVIRRNKIIMESDTAILAFGPGTLIEDNDIEVRGKQSLDGPLRHDAAAIRLIQADGAIVRNNRIRYTGDELWSRTEAGIRIERSRNVVVENNRGGRINRMVSSDLQSTHRATGNRIEY